MDVFNPLSMLSCDMSVCRVFKFWAYLCTILLKIVVNKTWISKKDATKYSRTSRSFKNKVKSYLKILAWCEISWSSNWSTKTLSPFCCGVHAFLLAWPFSLLVVFVCKSSIKAFLVSSLNKRLLLYGISAPDCSLK